MTFQFRSSDLGQKWVILADSFYASTTKDEFGRGRPPRDAALFNIRWQPMHRPATPMAATALGLLKLPHLVRGAGAFPCGVLDAGPNPGPWEGVGGCQ